MSDNNKGLNISEISQILRNSSEEYEDISEQKFDAYDKLIKEIILIERQHKYGSTGLDRKLKDIEKQIDRFINTNDFGE